MNIDEFSQLFSEFRQSAFRLETLQIYNVEFETQALAQYNAGGPLPVSPPNSDWVELVRMNVSSGKSMSRVHVLKTPLTPYIRFEIDWGYSFSAQAGEDIRLCFSEEPEFSQIGDFWIFDDSIAVKMFYDTEGRFLYPEKVQPSELEACLTARDLAIEKSVQLQEYLATKQRCEEL